LKSKALPLSLVKDTYNKTLSQGERLLQVQSFGDTFGPQSRRKRPNLTMAGIEEMVATVEQKQGEYDQDKDIDYHKNDFVDEKDEARHAVFEKGLSKRIWEELYKVVDSSDVLIYVLDARCPDGTRNKSLEEHLKKNCPAKHLVFVLNKCDLVPTAVTQKWVRYLQQFAPTLCFQASQSNPFGKGSLIQLLKQFDNLHREKKCISVGFIGYPNVGKSSIINALMKKNVCKVAPIPGETKVWQYITLTKRIYLIDCPGIVYDTNESQVDKVLKGVVRAEKIPDPDSYIQAIIDRVQPKHIADIFGVHSWTNSEDFIIQVAERTGKLLKGGEPDINNVAKSIIFDWQRGNIPYFTKAPQVDKDAVNMTRQVGELFQKRLEEQ
jgi:nuclear GTP-binding protein